MIKGILIGGGLIFAGLTVGGAKAMIDSQLGAGAFDSAVHYGTRSASQTFAEVPTAANEVIDQNKKPIGDLLHQGTGAIASATGGATWDQPVDPSQQQAAPTTSTVKP